MGFAKLSYANNGTVLSTTVLHDIVGCITGNFTSTDQLKGAIKEQSEIITGNTGHWKMEFPMITLPENPVNTYTSWVLSAPCVDTDKTKYIRLCNYSSAGVGNGYILANSGGTGALNSYFLPANGSSSTTQYSGIYLQAITGASSETAVSNPTYYNFSINNNSRGPVMNIMNGSVLYISWSARHIVIWSSTSGFLSTTTGGTTPLLIAYFEYPETELNQSTTATPTIYFLDRNANFSAGITQYSGFEVTTYAVGAMLIPQYYSTSTNSTTPLCFSSPLNTNDRICSTISNTAFINYSAPTITSTGANSAMMVPIIVSPMSKNYPPMYLSEYSNVFLASSSLGTAGDTVTVGNDEYVLLITSTASPAFLIKKA
jgi:hypothetical protein